MTTQVLVLGGGYAGLMAANRLTQRDDVAVTLLNPRPFFVERIRLHQLAAGTGDAVHSFERVLSAKVRVVVGEAERIDAGARRVLLRDGGELGYDWLVDATGSRSSAGAPGVAEHAIAIGSLEEATRLREALTARPGEPVVVVGGGPTGIETAAELAEQGGRTVTLLARSIVAPAFHARARGSLTRRLARLGVTVHDGAGVARVEPGQVVLDDGRTLTAGVTVWAAGFEPSGLAARSGLTTDASGRLLTDETLTSVDDPRIVAAGDAASPSGVPERMSCQAALPLGLTAADTVLARLAGREPRTVANVFVGQCVSLGRRDATMQLSHLDDTSSPWFIAGRTGARVKELICRTTVGNLEREARKPGSNPNPRSKARTRVLAAAGVHDGGAVSLGETGGPDRARVSA